jgi:GTP-binding protein
VNKVDRPGARPHWVMDQVFDLFDRLGATDEQLDFPVIYASALNGVAGPEPDQLAEDMTPLLDLIIERVPPPPADVDGPFQMQICALDYRQLRRRDRHRPREARRGKRPGMQVVVIEADGTRRNARINAVLGQMGLEKRRDRRRRGGRHREHHRHRQPEDLLDAVRPGHAGGAAPADHRPAHREHDLPGQRLAVRRPRGPVRDQPQHP